MFDLTYYLKRCFFLFCYAIQTSILSVFYWGRKRTVPPVKNLLLLKSATTLAEEIRTRKIRCIDVIQAYIDRILEVNPIINAVVQDNFAGALEEAEEVDLLIESKKFSSKELSEKKPLLGVPFTAKCCYSVKGFQLSAGSKLFKDKIATEDAACVALLKKAGGIFLALTNVPEFTCSNESVNYLYGRTCNPYDTTRTPGGSSGGEGALISSAGSVIGIGTDIYGSNRIPASYCGIFGFKPTRGWTPQEGLFPVVQLGMVDYLSTGPLCRYSEDLTLLLKVLRINKDKNLNWNPQVKFKKLKIYYQTDANYVWGINTKSEIAEAVRKAVFHFKEVHDCEVMEVKVPFFNECNAIALHVFRGDLTESEFRKIVTEGKLKEWKTMQELTKAILGKSQVTLIASALMSLLYTSIFYDPKKIPIYRKLLQELVRVWENLLDEDSVFICPSTVTTAFYHTQLYTHYYSTFFTGVFNLVGFPAVQCPMGFSKKQLPIGVQIASCKGNDALTIACATELEKVFGGWVPPQHNS